MHLKILENCYYRILITFFGRLKFIDQFGNCGKQTMSFSYFTKQFFISYGC